MIMFVAGIVLYDGKNVTSFGLGLYSIPIRILWEIYDAGHRTGSAISLLYPDILRLYNTLDPRCRKR